MKDSFRFEPSADFVDPRTGPGFQPECWPLCNGKQAPPPGSKNIHEKRSVEFLAAFYRINVLNAKLLAARAAHSSNKKANAILAEISKAMAALEKLEDRYTPIGFFGEPEMEGIRYRNITFIRPSRPKGPHDTAQFSSYFAIPGIEEIPAKQLEGPVRIIRYG